MKSFELLAITVCLSLIIIPFYAEGQTSTTVPAKPTLTATVISSSQVNLSWTIPSNGGSSITGYKIEYKIIPADYLLLVQINGNTTTTYSHTGLQSDKYYVYKIFAINSVGTSEASSEAIGHTQQPQNIVPNPPTGLNVKAVSPTKINLFWNAPSNNGGPLVSGYKIEEKAGTGSYSIVIANTGNTNTSYSRTGLTTGTTYTYRVSAINSVGTSSTSNEDSDIPTASSAATVPTPPSNLTATKISQTQINLAWVAPSNNGGELVSGYKIEEKVGTGSYSVIVANTGNTNTAYSRTGLTAGQTYTYRVSAINSVGAGTASNEATSAQTISVVPNPPTSLVVTSSSNTQLNLSWKAPTDNGGPAVTGYKIEEKVGSGSYSVIVSSTGNTNTVYSRTGLITGTTYTYKVSAINSVGTGTASNEASGKPTKTTTPTNLIAVAVTPNQISLCWFAPSETLGQSIYGYRIEKVISIGVYTEVVENTGKQTTAHTITGVTTDTPYTFVVSAVYPLGASGRSNEASATLTSSSSSSATSCATSTSSNTGSTPTPPPSQTGTTPNPPTSLTIRAVSPTKINLFWAEPTNNGGSIITGYKIEMKSGSSSWSTFNTGYSTATFSKDGLTTDTQYTFRVSAINSIGASNPSNEASTTPKSSSESGPPAAPTNLSAKAVSQLPALGTAPSPAINMTWNAPLDNGGLAITGYKISQKVGSNTYHTLVEDTKNTKTWYTHSNLAAGTTYTYKIAAINSAGEGNPSIEVSATTQSSSIPSPTPIPTPTPTPTPIPTPHPSIGRVKVHDTDFALRYEITDGKVSKTDVDVETNALHIKMDATDDGKLVITLPRPLIDAKTNDDKDDVFYVVADDKEAKFTEETTSDSRVLSIDFPDKTSEIIIYGTQSVPEFPIVALILVASITITLIITRTKWNKINPN